MKKKRENKAKIQKSKFLMAQNLGAKGFRAKIFG